MAPLQGLQPLVQPVGFIDTSPELSAEDQQGGAADPRHALPLAGYRPQQPWEVLGGLGIPHGPYGTEAQLIGTTEGLSDPAGSPSEDPYFDNTPLSHAAPWPKGVEQSTDPDATARQLHQSASIHASDTGASRGMAGRLDALQDHWEGFYTVDAGSSIQDPDINAQLRSAGAGGYGSTDRVSSLARQNSFGFDSAHLMRRYASGSVPGNYMWMQPGGRPMIKTMPGTARPAVGADSPFTGQDLTRSFGSQGAILEDAPNEYVPPPDPYIAPQQGPAPDPAPVAWW